MKNKIKEQLEMLDLNYLMNLWIKSITEIINKELFFIYLRISDINKRKKIQFSLESFQKF